jgi:hypothetical protein
MNGIFYKRVRNVAVSDTGKTFYSDLLLPSEQDEGDIFLFDGTEANNIPMTIRIKVLENIFHSGNMPGPLS